MVRAEDLTVTAHTQATLDRLSADVPSLHTTLSNLEACRDASMVLLCIKPWLVQSVLEEIYPAIHASNPLLISVAAGITFAQKAFVKALFDELGSAIVIDEAHMAAGTAVTSCGIAYALQYIKAAIQGAIELGFYPQVAKQMIDQTVLGAVNLLEQNGTMPDAEIYKVCTPGGITIKGLNEMTREGFDNAVIQGLKKAAGK